MIIKVVRRPYMFVYLNDKDRTERAVINLSSTQIEFSEETLAMIQVSVFRCGIKMENCWIGGNSGVDRKWKTTT
jgi:hypothetical protein